MSRNNPPPGQDSISVYPVNIVKNASRTALIDLLYHLSKINWLTYNLPHEVDTVRGLITSLSRVPGTVPMISYVNLPITLPSIIQPFCAAIDSDPEALALLLVELEANLSTSTVDSAITKLGKVDGEQVSELLKYITNRLSDMSY